MGKILITGGTGLVGQHLIEKLVSKNHEVVVLSRSPKQANAFLWDIKTGYIDEKAFENVTSIIHLAGAGIADKRWSSKRKESIIFSRVASTKLLLQKVLELKVPLKQFISASGIGYYGAMTSQIIFQESDEVASDFLGNVCKKWELAATEFSSINCTTTILRTGIVLTKKGGALEKMITPIVSPIGTGNQYLPWIHIDDLCEMYIKAVEDTSFKGVYNAVAPEHHTSKTFSKLVATCFKKPFLPFRVPAFLLKLIFGEMAVILLEGSRISSEKVIATGFQFQYENLKHAMEELSL